MKALLASLVVLALSCAPLTLRAQQFSVGSATPSGPASGDLGGTYPSPTVAKVTNAATIGVGIAVQTGDQLSVYSNSAAASATVYGDGQFGLLSASSAKSGANGTFLQLFGSQGTIAVPTAIGAGTQIATINYQGHDGTAYRGLVQLRGVADTVTGNNNISGYFTVWTRPDGAAASLTEALRVTKNQHLSTFSAAIPGVTSCGTGSPTVAAGSTDTAGTVTIGTTATACTIAFNKNYTGTNAPACTFTDITVAANLTSVAMTGSTGAWTGFTLTMTSNSGNNVNWVCMGLGGA